MTDHIPPRLPRPKTPAPEMPALVLALQRRGRILLLRVLPRLGRALVARLKAEVKARFTPAPPVSKEPQRRIRVDRRV